MNSNTINTNPQNIGKKLSEEEKTRNNIKTIVDKFLKANNDLVKSSGVNVAQRMADNITKIVNMKAKGIDERRIFLLLAGKLCHAHTQGQLNHDLINNMTEHMHGIPNASKEELKTFNLEDVYFTLEMAFKRLTEKNNFEIFDKLITYFDGRLEKQLSFVYDTIVPPYQLKGEGSCFATANLIVLWNNFPTEWMFFIAGIIEYDKANFNLFKHDNARDFQRKDLIIDVSQYGYRDEGIPTQIYQKALSAIALLVDKNFIKNQERKISSKIEKFTKTNFDEDIAETINLIIDIYNNEIVWSYGTWMPVVCIPRQIEMLRAEAGCLLDNNIDKIITSLYEDNEELKNSGGNTEYIINELLEDEIEKKEVFLNPLMKDSKIFISKMKEILDPLSNEKEGSLALFSFAQKIVTDDSTIRNQGHAMTLIARKYDIDNMEIGTRIRIGLGNYYDERKYIFLKKISNEEVQLILNAKDLPDNKPDIPLSNDGFSKFVIFIKKRTE